MKRVHVVVAAFAAALLIVGVVRAQTPATPAPQLSAVSKAQLARLEQAWRFSSWRVEMAMAERNEAEAALSTFLTAHRIDGFVLFADGTYRPMSPQDRDQTR